MAKDVLELVEGYVGEDPLQWGKLSSQVTSRHLELLLLREILVELRKLNQTKGASAGAS
ncbi:MAG: hypothetical protein QGG56_05755 [Dehalococcoidia bacterium]|jgi:hypothetical protein|nr:hypothetical protein [Dehalococcoidia bacterium]